ADQPSTTDEAAATSGIALPGAPVHEADTGSLNGLIRAQLRLAAGCLAAFLLVSLALTLLALLTARSADPIRLGVPLAWLLQAYAYYPIILVFAIVSARGATRNERRYRALAGDGRGASR